MEQAPTLHASPDVVIGIASIDGAPTIAPPGLINAVDDRAEDERTPPRTLDVVVPVFNEEACLDELISRFDAVRGRFADREIVMRMIPVDDGSSDRSPTMLAEASRRHEWISPVWLARNFGHQAAVTAGLDASDGTWCAVIDADLQDPPELLVEMTEQLRAGDAQVVYGQRLERKGESTFKLRTAHWFYRVMRRGSGLDIPLDAGDFRVMNASVVADLTSMREHHRLLRAMVPWLGHHAEPHGYTRDSRYAGETKYPLRSMVKLASHAVFSFSTLPIRIVQALGLALCSGGGIGIAGLVVLALLDIQAPAAAWLVGAFAMQTGLVVLSIGLIGGYVFRIQDEVKGRPLYITRDMETTS